MDTEITEKTESPQTPESKFEAKSEESVEELKARLEQLSSAVAMLQSSLQSTHQQPAPQQLNPEQIEEYNRKFIENPIEMLAKVMENYQKQAVEKATRQAEEKLALERFWNRFSQKYPNLYGEKWALDKVIEEDFGVIQKLGSEEKIMDYIAKKAVTKITEAYKAVNERKPSATAEGYQPFAWPSEPTEPASSPDKTSLAALIKDRKLKRMQSRGLL